MRSPRRYFFTFGLILLCFVMLMGCWDSKELDSLFIVTGIGLDAVSDSDEIEITVQIGKVGEDKESGKQASGSSIIMKAQSQSVYGAINDLRANSTRNLFLEHNQVIIFSRELAERGIKPYIDFFTRNPEARMEVFLLVTDDKTDALLDTKQEIEMDTSIALSRMQMNQKVISKVLGTRMLDMVLKLIEEKGAITVPIVAKKTEDDREYVVFKNLAVFKEDRMVGTLNDDETLGFVLAMGDVNSGVISLKTQDGECKLDIVHADSTIVPTLFTDGSVRVEIQVEAELTVGELMGYTEDAIETLEPALAKAASDEIRRLISLSIEQTRSLDADIFDIGRMMEMEYPKHWSQYQNRWDEIYQQIDWNINVNARITGDGRISSPLTMEKGTSNVEAE